MNLRFAPGSFLVGVRFRPGAAPPLVGVSAAELRDLEIPIGELWGRAGAAVTERSIDSAPAIDPVATGIAATLALRPPCRYGSWRTTSR